MTDRVLVLCTANRIRSVLFGASLCRHVIAAGWGDRVQITTAGLLEPGQPPTPAAVGAAARFGRDVRDHLSVRVTRHHLLEADLILGAERHHVAEVYAMAPEQFSRAFTYIEFGALVGSAPPRAYDETLSTFVERVSPARTPLDVANAAADLDVSDPASEQTARVLQTGAALERLAARIAARTWPACVPALWPSAPEP
jgi:protein-tyrosine phosphatase